MSSQSPIMLRLLDYLLPADLHHLVGDLEEEFRQRIDDSTWQAYLNLYYQILLLLPLIIKNSLGWSIIMLKNYLKVTWRNIRNTRVFSTINVLGLSVSMAICLLIILFIVDQKSYDRFHEHSDRIYRVISNYKSFSSNQAEYYATTPANLAGLAEERLPEVAMASPINDGFSGELRYGDKTIQMGGMYVDTTFFNMFSFELIRGSIRSFRDPGNIILTETGARKLFGEEDPMGKVITSLGDRDYTITGIIRDDYRSHFRFEALVSYATLRNSPQAVERLDDWVRGLNNSYTYLLLRPDSKIPLLESKLSSLIPGRYATADEEVVLHDFKLQSLTAINLGPALSNEIGLVMPGFIAWFLAGFAGIIIIIACFNYVSLTVARAINRSKEVGVRKVMGAFRSNILKQFLAESVIIALIALLFASLMLRWLIPEFNSLNMINFTENQISIDLWGNYIIYAIFLFFSVFIGILAGIYPALYLSSFNPASVLKGTQSGKSLSGQTLRKVITVSQFVFSVLFIITALILAKQFDHMVNTDYGFNRQGIVNVALQDVPYDRFRDAITQQPDVENVASTSHIPALGQTYGVWMNSDSLTERVRANSFLVDEHYIETTGLNLLAGRNFNPDRSTDSTAVILSEVAVSDLGLGSNREALGKFVTIDEESFEVVGVIKNFISANPMNKGNPIVLLYRPGIANYAIVKVRTGNISGFISDLESTWANIGSLHALQYKFLDNQLEENLIITLFLDFIKVIGMIAFFSIFISCLGLLGMAMYAAENRVKEIGIRKVLGANVKDIIYLMSKDYLLLVGIALAIGTPLAWLVNNLWMQMISNKADIGLWIFIAGIAGTTVLAILTVGSQAFRAARADSINNLRSE